MRDVFQQFPGSDESCLITGRGNLLFTVGVQRKTLLAVGPLKVQCIHRILHATCISLWFGTEEFRLRMTSSYRNIFRVTGPLCEEFPSQRPWRGAVMFSLICAWINGWVNNPEAGDLRCHRGHYDVIVMYKNELKMSTTKWRPFLSAKHNVLMQTDVNLRSNMVLSSYACSVIFFKCFSIIEFGLMLWTECCRNRDKNFRDFPVLVQAY